MLKHCKITVPFVSMLFSISTLNHCKQSPIQSSDSLHFQEEPEELTEVSAEEMQLTKSFGISISFVADPRDQSDATSWCLSAKDDETKSKTLIPVLKICSSSKEQSSVAFQFEPVNDEITGTNEDVFVLKYDAMKDTCLTFIDDQSPRLTTCSANPIEVWSIDTQSIANIKFTQLVYHNGKSDDKCLGHERQSKTGLDSEVLRLVSCKDHFSQTLIRLNSESIK